MEDSTKANHHYHHTQDFVSDATRPEDHVPLYSPCPHSACACGPDWANTIFRSESCAAVFAPSTSQFPKHVHPMLDAPPLQIPQPLHDAPSRRTSLRNQELIALKNAYSSINSDISCSSVSSVESLLELRRENPEEILLALGFGGCFEDNLDPLLRIPCRFFEQQSKAKGVSVGDIIDQRRSRLLYQTPAEKAEKERNSAVHSSQIDPMYDEPLKQSAKQTKLLVMGHKSYHFDCDEPELYSPKTSAVVDSMEPPFPSFSSQIRHSHSPNASHHSNENFLSVPLGPFPYRKLSCPNIDTELSHYKRSEIKSEHSRGRPPVRAASTDMPNVSFEQMSHMSSIFTRTESLGRLKPNLTSMLAEISSNSNLNFGYFIETALITTIESLKMSLDFYRYFMLVRSDSIDGETCDNTSEMSTSDYGSKVRIGEDIDQIIRAQARSRLAMERNKQRLSLQNIYLDVLEVETMLYDCLAKFKNSSNWPVFVSKYIQKLQKAVDKISGIQESLRCLNANYSRSFSDFTTSS